MKSLPNVKIFRYGANMGLFHKKITAVFFNNDYLKV